MSGPATCPVCGAPRDDVGCVIELGHEDDDATVVLPDERREAP